jgi:hypothetical protein
LVDAQILPFSSLGDDPNALAEALLSFADRAKARGATHLGLSFAKKNGRHALVAILSRRLVTLSPLAANPSGRSIVVRGRAAAAMRVDALVLGPCTSDLCLEGHVDPLDVARKADLISVRVPFEGGQGRYTVELLAQGDRGPEIAALWTFAVGVATNEPARLPSTEKNDVRALESLIAHARDQNELAPLSRSAPLDRAAQKHAEAVCGSMVAAHVMEGRDPPARAKAEGYAGSVLENVAIAENVTSAHRNFLLSPSHRTNVFSATSEQLGLGVSSKNGTVCVVELYGR